MVKELRSGNTLQENVILSLEDVGLDGELRIPEGASSIVMFIHGSGSSRFSPRNQFVAKEMSRYGLATLLFDLMSPEEEELDGQLNLRFDIDFLARRVVEASRWLREYAVTEKLRLGYFGASTGAAAALVAAAALPNQVRAVVSRGGRPDLAGARLEKVKAPTLLIVGQRDEDVLELNRKAASHLNCEYHLEIVPHATHLFEEEGTLERVAELAEQWFAWHTTR